MYKKKTIVFILTMVMLMIMNVGLVFASSLEDLSNGQATSVQDSETSKSAVADYLRGREAVTAENMAEAEQYVSPITNIMGTATGIIMAFTCAAIFLITALDLLYIGFPPMRSILYPAGQSAPQGGMPMGGMGMGRMGMMGGGMAMGGMQGSQAMATGSSHRWVSDEAIAAVALSQPVAAQAPVMGGGMGMGMAGMGMGMPMANQAPAGNTAQSAITVYFKKRIVFVVVFGICSVVLLSSVLTDCGLNVGMLILKIIGKISNSASSISF